MILVPAFGRAHRSEFTARAVNRPKHQDLKHVTPIAIKKDTRLGLSNRPDDHNAAQSPSYFVRGWVEYVMGRVRVLTWQMSPCLLQILRKPQTRQADKACRSMRTQPHRRVQLKGIEDVLETAWCPMSRTLP